MAEASHFLWRVTFITSGVVERQVEEDDILSMYVVSLNLNIDQSMEPHYAFPCSFFLTFQLIRGNGSNRVVDDPAALINKSRDTATSWAGLGRICLKNYRSHK